MNKKGALMFLEKNGIDFLLLQFTDIMGINKNVEVPKSQFEKALNGEIMFDGSSIEGFARIEESDMLLKPDIDTLMILPFEHKEKIARLMCDIKNPDNSDFDGCPRTILKRVVEKAKNMGFQMMVGTEPEFFLFEKDQNKNATTISHDGGGYFDLAPIDRGEKARRAIVEVLIKMGFEIEASHHEVAPGQHEIDFKYENVVLSADNIATFKYIVRKIASDFDLHATFMPKPIYGINGSGMHVHQSLFKNNKNAFYDKNKKWQLSDTALYYIGGLLEHVRGFSAITNPLVNSYKRLVPGYEAPTSVAWSMKNRTPLIRIPARRGKGTRLELRSPDPSANPYLSLAVMLASGLFGIENKILPPEPVNKNIFKLTVREKRRLRIKELPENLNQAIDQFEKDQFIINTLGEHISKYFIYAKRMEWKDYISQVNEWEIKKYLCSY